MACARRSRNRLIRNCWNSCAWSTEALRSLSANRASRQDLRPPAVALFLFRNRIRFRSLQVQCNPFSVDENNAAADQFLASAVIFLIASERGEGNHELH